MLIDESTGSNLVVQDEVHESLLTLWKEIVGEQLICQIELLAMVLVRWQWMRELHNRRVLLFVDNNSARGGPSKADPLVPRWMTWSRLFTRLKFICHHSGG